LTPIMAERNEGTLQIQRYYVWSPGGQLLYLIDAASGNAVRFFHYDRVGSTLALTSGAGAVTDAYAYSPYGVLLGHTGTSLQPFTYIGEFGVRGEATANLYHMRARYYDPVSERFLTRDSLWPRLADNRTLDPYTYANESPLLFIDPQGREVDIANAGFALMFMPAFVKEDFAKEDVSTDYSTKSGGFDPVLASGGDEVLPPHLEMESDEELAAATAALGLNTAGVPNGSGLCAEGTMFGGGHGDTFANTLDAIQIHNNGTSPSGGDEKFPIIVRDRVDKQFAGPVSEGRIPERQQLVSPGDLNGDGFPDIPVTQAGKTYYFVSWMFLVNPPASGAIDSYGWYHPIDKHNSIAAWTLRGDRSPQVNGE
ncbi:MAG TPA: RHS repeat-associated core domain-containing protein, partial [Verrucomicrobiae bacterium]